jgi:hypothetical protein
MGHFVFLIIFLFLRNIIAPVALKIAVNSRGCNAALSIHFRHGIHAESPRNCYLAATKNRPLVTSRNAKRRPRSFVRERKRGSGGCKEDQV